MKSFLFIAGMIVVIVGACIQIYNRVRKVDSDAGRYIELAGLVIASISLAL